MNLDSLSDTLAILGYIVGIVGLLCLIGAIVMRFEWACERDDDVARAAGGMDEFSAPEGGRRS